MAVRIRQQLAILFCALCLALAGCDRDNAGSGAADASAAWEAHLEDRTSGWIGADTTLRFRFRHPVIAPELLNKPLDGIVKLQPAHDVVAVFTAEDRLEVRHAQPFPAGASFELVLSPGRLINLPGTLGDLRYTLQVLEQGLSVREFGLLVDPRDADALILEGEIQTSDAAEPAAVERVLNAALDDAALAVAWTHPNPRSHRFSVQAIARGAGKRELRVNWDGEPIGVNSRGERRLEVPARRVFELGSARAVQAPEHYIEARFSAALDGAQNLQGIARIDGLDARAQVDGSVLRVYPAQRLAGEVRLEIAANLLSAGGRPLAQAVERNVMFTPETPAVRFAGQGHILPAAARLSIPFEAVAVTAVRLRAFEIYADNIPQYLQQGELDFKGQRSVNEYTHRDVGRYLWQKTLTLPEVPLAGWQRFELDVSELMANKKGSLLRLELEILPQHSAYVCELAPAASSDAGAPRSYDGFYRDGGAPAHLARYYESAGYWDWDKRNDPCHASYFNHNEKTSVAQLFFASSIGLLAKQGGTDELHVLATDLRSAEPLRAARIGVFNYQQQRIGGGTTDADGLLSVTLQGVPFYVRAESEGDVGWLKVPRNDPLPTSQFETGGAKAEQGIKGFFYGERDIWRPGDALYLTFVVMDRDARLPDDYPLTLELFDPRGGKVQSLTNAQPLGGFYTFRLQTAENAPTGNWRAIVKIGDQYFDRVLKIENIAPNRLKLALELPEDGLHAEQLPLATAVEARWLNGSSAAALRADVQLRLRPAATRIQGLDGYVFDDRARSFSQEPLSVFEGVLDRSGRGAFELALALDAPPPGMLEGVFTQRVFEPGGQFSTQYRSLAFYPFSTWVGIHAPDGEAAYAGALDETRDHAFELRSVDSRGKAVAGRPLELTLHAIEWRWWWESGDENLARYISDDVHRALERVTLTTDANGHASWTLASGRYEPGRHLLRVCDAGASGVAQHCSSHEVYLGWGQGEQHGRDAATRMALATDRERYAVGDSARIQLPRGAARRVFVSLENGSRVLARYWQQLDPGESHIDVALSAEMSPTVYAHLTQLQPHQGRDNDLPIRAYGIVALQVEDPATRLLPVIEAPATTRPESLMDVAVSERQGRPMNYTLAVVDEGLLGITDYRTPDPHDAFYRREALGVLTWDLFDQVVGAYGAELSRLLAVGGSDTVLKPDSNRERRFPPIVRFLGPFALAAGATASHPVELPPYMGAVRVMVVAGDGRAWGKAEQEVGVTQPLTVLATLPRVLGPGEELELPVTAFVSEPPFGEARISAAAATGLSVIEGERRLRFERAGEATARLRLRVDETIGTARVEVRAELGGERAREVVHLPVRSPNLPSTQSERRLLQPGESWTPALAPHGISGTNTSSLSVSRAPEFALEQRLDSLLGYPHGCIEQTVSAAFPQLYLADLAQLDAAQTRERERNIDAAISRLAGFQTAEGGFAYWPYQPEVASWANNYAGHFLLEARSRGHSVPAALLGNWVRQQQAAARSFNDRSAHLQADQAYRLYTLALASEPDAGAMNRLREALKQTPRQQATLARWLLALAYQHTGMRDVALELQDAAGDSAAQFPHAPWFYGSELRDRSVLLLLRQRLGQRDAAWQLGEELARDLASERWYSTHSTAWALLALAQTFGEQRTAPSRFALGDAAGAWQQLTSERAVYRQALENFSPGALTVRNDGQQPLRVTLSHRGTRAAGDELPREEGLEMQLGFSDLDGQSLAIDSLPQGQDFVARVTLRNRSGRALDHVALTQVLPSGWQIRNTRLEGAADDAAIAYQDVRDDRVQSYFALAAGGGAGWPAWWQGRQQRRIGDTVTVDLLLNASFAGRFYLPGWRAEPMYDGDIGAASSGRWVEVLAR